MAFRIMMAGGGSGGHVYPLVAIAEEVKRLSPQYHRLVQMRFIGDGELMATSARQLDISFRHVSAPKWRRYKSAQNFFDILKVPIALIQSVIYVWSYMPDVMLIKGGYAAFFPALAARIMFIPLVVHESDSIPGKTNSYWARHARRVFLAFEHARQYFPKIDTEVVGNPIRPELLAPRQRKTYDKPVVFITGGSQGAKVINDVVELARAELEKNFTIIHQKDGTWNAEQMAQAYTDADVIVSRAGSSIFEIAASGKPAVLIPLDGSAQNHQEANAQEFGHHGAIVLPQSNLTEHILISEIKRAYDEREKLSASIKAFARPDAATIIAKELLYARI